MDGNVVVCGRVFPHDSLQRINAAVRDHPEWSRADVARRVCDWLDWRAATGKRKEVNCRAALVRLERRGLIDLPPPRRRVRFSGSRFAATRLNVPVRLEGSVHELCKLELVLVNSKDRERDLQWKKLVATHHYLGYRPLCGAQLRYLISCEHGYAGALGFSAAALYLKARDRWIGWSHAARQAYLRYVVANSRFVIARQVKVVNLASKVLAMAQKRLAKDWQQAYGYRPLLLETYVESKRFAATSYRAANWILCGAHPRPWAAGSRPPGVPTDQRYLSLCVGSRLPPEAVRGTWPGAALAHTVYQATQAAARLGRGGVWGDSTA